MLLKSTLVAISNDARGWLKSWAGDFTEDEAGRSGSSPANPLSWQLGHIACAEEDVVCLFGGVAVVPDALRRICGNGCPTPGASTVYQRLAELWQLLERTHGTLIGMVETASDADFDRPALRENPFFRTFGQAVYEIALHENYHVGEIATLRKGLGKKRIG